uniref:Uncharacterized protein n=1 Tax=Anguilla anguilla TaxID=7936 RepID=A0A0E9Y0F2_ANGAN
MLPFRLSSHYVICSFSAKQKDWMKKCLYWHINTFLLFFNCLPFNTFTKTKR